MLVQQINIGALGRLCWYSRVLLEHPVVCVGRAQYYRSTRREAVLAQQSTIEALGSLGWYSRILLEPCGGCAGAADYYRITRKVVLVQKGTIGTLGSLGCYSRMLVGCVGTEGIIGVLWRLCWYSRVR